MFRMYVGNLPYQLTEDELRDFFTSAGCTVAASGGESTDRFDNPVVIVRMPDGKSKGFGFVTFADEESFNKAQGLDKQEFKGRSLNVSPARPKEDRA